MRFAHGRAAAAIASLALAVTGCAQDPKPAAQPTPPPSPTISFPGLSGRTTVSPTPANLSPLTGLAAGNVGPVVAVKVDNAPSARPQVGLDRADVVYEEIVEGRATRFLAVFGSQDAEVGPVRSVRESDLELLRMYGKVLFAFSGGNVGVKAAVRRAPVIEVGYDALPGLYRKGAKRRDAQSFFTTTGSLRGARSGGATPKDIGLRFGERPDAAPAERITGKVHVTWGPFSSTAFTYDAATQLWYRSADGGPSMLRGGTRMSTPNVVIQYVKVRASRFSDVGGNVTPYTSTIGKGEGLVLRDGSAVPVTWERKGDGPTRFRTKDGADALLRPGPVWVLLVPTGTRAQLTP